ncbi:MAG TPA: BREX-3 system P-loop-containing protein BrxF [Verrucomicrobiota bacterium]|nr:BREX-3 system P-loop-containing protein BrxF [Verrucomicrobiota bacterium]
MTDLRFPQLLDTIRATQGAYYKLTILAGGARSGKTKLLHQVAGQLGFPLINLSLHLSQRLLSQSRRQRSLNAEAVAIDVIDEHLKSGLCLDDTELLFDKTLKTNPLVFLQDISRNRLIVATWNGVVTDGELRYGHTGHPDYFSKPVSGYPVVSVAEDKLQLHLTT